MTAGKWAAPRFMAIMCTKASTGIPPARHSCYHRWPVFDPFYGALHTKAHGINNLSQLVGTGKEGEPNFYTHAALWPNKDTEAIDLGFLGQGIPLNYSEAYGVNDLSHVVGNGAIGSFIHGFLWRNGQMTDLGALSGQVASEARAINNTGLIAGKSNIFPVVWEYDTANPNRAPRIQQLPIPAGFFSATTTAVNDSGDVVGYAGSPNIDSHAILWRNGMAIDLGVWPGGHYSVANGINNLGQIVGTGTVAGDNLDHALMWTVDEGGGGIPCGDLRFLPGALQVHWRRRPQIAGPAYPHRHEPFRRAGHHHSRWQPHSRDHQWQPGPTLDQQPGARATHD